MKYFKKLLVFLMVFCLAAMPALTGLAEEGAEAPSETQETEVEPTAAPTPEPTKEPTPAPTEAPTPEPTQEPTPAPTDTPVPEDTPEPEEEPTQEPEETEAPEASTEPEPDESEEPSESPEATESPEDSDSPEPDESVEPDESPEADELPEDSVSLETSPEPYVIDEEGTMTLNAAMTTEAIMMAITGAETEVQKIVVSAEASISGGAMEMEIALPVENAGVISGGIFGAEVTNNGSITDGDFRKEVDNNKTISGGSFTGAVTNASEGVISGGDFTVTVTAALTNDGEIKEGTFSVSNTGTLTNNGKITGGTFNNGHYINNETDGVISDGKFYLNLNLNHLNNRGVISGGEFVIGNQGLVVNDNVISGGEFGANGGETHEDITNNATINGGSFDCNVTNYEDAKICNAGSAELIPSFAENRSVHNYGTIEDGEFSGKVYNGEDQKPDEQPKPTTSPEPEEPRDGKITGGTFKKTSEIYNYWTLEEIKTEGSIICGYKSVVKGCEVGVDLRYAAGAEEIAISDCKVTGILYIGANSTADSCTVDGQLVATGAGSKLTGCTANGQFQVTEGATAEGCTLNGEISVGAGSSAMNNTFGPDAHVNAARDGRLEVYYYIEGNEERQAGFYGGKVLETLEKADKNKVWYSYATDASDKVVVKDTDTFGIEALTYVQAKAPATPTPQPTYTPKPTYTPAPTDSSSGGGSGSGSGGGYAWEDPVANPSWGEVEEELGLNPASDLTNGMLNDGGEADLDILFDGEGKPMDYELIAIATLPPAQTATVSEDADSMDIVLTSNPGPAVSEDDDSMEIDLTGMNSAQVSEDEDSMEIDLTGASSPAVTEDEDSIEIDLTGTPDDMLIDEIKRIPGEADENGDMLPTLFVRAKGLGTEPRTLSLTMAQLQNMYEEQKIEVLLFRNGSTTVSLSLKQLFEDKLPKLMELMQAWSYNEADFADYDIAQIDFDAIQMTPEFDEDELRAFSLELSIVPAAPVGYTVSADLFLDDNSKDIGLLLEDMGVTLHVGEVDAEVGVYYMNAEEQRFLLESHEGTVPGVSDWIEGYEVLHTEGEEGPVVDVTTLSRSVNAGEFDGLCTFAGEGGTYYVGILPTVSSEQE